MILSNIFISLTISARGVVDGRRGGGGTRFGGDYGCGVGGGGGGGSGLRRQEGRIGFGARRIGIWPGRRPQPCWARTPHPLGSGRRHTDPRYFLAGLAGKGAVRGRAVGIHPG